MRGFKKTNGLAPPPVICPTPMTVATPFLEAREEWDRRDGMKVRRVKRLESSLVLAWIAIVLLVGYAIMAPGKTRYLPYVVEVAQSGQIRTVGILPQQWQGQSPAPIDFVVRLWLRWVREIPDSKVAWGVQWQNANAFLTTKGQQQIVPYATGRDALQKRGETVQIEITSLLPMQPDYRLLAVEWTEHTYTQQGTPRGMPEEWKAVVQIGVYPPKEVQDHQQMRNTLGIFVTGWSWSPKSTKGMPYVAPMQTSSTP